VLTNAQLEAVLPHLANNNVRVVFEGFWDAEVEGFSSEQTSLLNRILNFALLECSLRHTQVPEYFLCDALHEWDETNVPFTQTHTLSRCA
jgi:hypothetical protein